MKRTMLKAIALFTTAISLSGCLTTEFHRQEIANRIASSAWMKARQIPAQPFTITAYERMHVRGDHANIYFSGDGKPTFFKDLHTPDNPVGLHLAAFDKSENLAYIARPCQFSGMLDIQSSCPVSFTQNKQFSPEVVTSMNAAIDDIIGRIIDSSIPGAIWVRSYGCSKIRTSSGL